MAVTKKALRIAAQKNLLRLQIEDANRNLRAACRRVPASVVSGSVQRAVAWKTEAERVTFGQLSGAARRASQADLERTLASKLSTLALLQGLA